MAILRYLDELQPGRIDSMERHTETAEVLMLLHGTGVQLRGGNQARVNGISPQAMDHGKIYNVKCNLWHTVILSRDASVLVVENRDTQFSF